ncbi:phenylalanine--tRNA ligase subunit alpha [Anaplasma capra]|nr:phenylalanine--tRNA ligase subunit alpha [Anaplasma capra]MCU7611771.1 phenylalanine--tRNA ligase subunit alpha [Anaplasma capra]MCU7612479.1 phenylalanine--tRNA ligase subunit alpha [Anaplasma capra]
MLVPLISKILSLSEEAGARVADCGSVEELNSIRAHYIGRSGVLTALLRQVSAIQDMDERKAVGSAANAACSELKLVIQNRELQLAREQMNSRLAGERVDVTLPSRPRIYGKMHPISGVIREIRGILSELGFSIVYGPELEDEFHVFDALNTPEHHPARDKNDTFYMAEKLNGNRVVLRTHTSSMQIRAMENNPSLPIKIISPGRVYRNDWDATHSPMFHQVEGLLVGKHVTMGHLKYCINYFLGRFFRRGVETRMRASFFPFTEPSAEVDVKNERGSWVEVLGCGMVHSKVLENVNIDPSEYCGFAFGMGVERMAMLKYGITDLRNFYSNKLEWLNHYGFCFTDILGMPLSAAVRTP